MRKWLLWARFVAVAAGYVLAFVLIRRAAPFSVFAPSFVIVAMVCFLGLEAMAGPVVPIRLPGPIRAVRIWEVRGRVYRALGVRAFGRLLRRTPLRWLNTDVYLGAGGRDAPRLRARLESAEASHFWAAALVSPYMVWLATRENWPGLAWVSLAQVAFNVYPVMHLRLTRHRLASAVRRLDLPAPGSGSG